MSCSLLERGESAGFYSIKADLRSDGNVRYYEYENDSLHFLTEYKSSDPRMLHAPIGGTFVERDLTSVERGMTFLPRRALDVEQNEIARAYKLYGTSVEPISFIVPRKAESFQSE